MNETTPGGGGDRPADIDSRINAMADRAVGAVIGSAVGDALGAGYEGSYPDQDEEIVMVGGRGQFPGRRRGGWTDDTAMALGVLDVIASGITSTDAIAANFVDWCAARPPDIGRQTRWVLSSAARPSEVRAQARAYMRRTPDAAGNGGLMRTAPVALAAPGDRNRVARRAAAIASLTHPHPDSVDACVLWSLAIDQAIITADIEEPFDFGAAVRNGLGFVPGGKRRDRWTRLIDTALATGSAAAARRRFTPNGWVVTAFQAALWAISHTPVPRGNPGDHFRDALVASIRVGHDTDTVAAIAGGLLGARWGVDSIPGHWIRVLHGDRVRGETVSGYELAVLASQAFFAGLQRTVAMRQRATEALRGSTVEPADGRQDSAYPGRPYTNFTLSTNGATQ